MTTQHLTDSFDRAAVEDAVAELDQVVAKRDRELEALKRERREWQAMLTAHARLDAMVRREDADHLPLSAKRERIRAILRSRRGQWTVREVRGALLEEGIDPDAGTAVKTILWHLARDGEIRALGDGAYELPAPITGAEHSDEERVAA